MYDRTTSENLFLTEMSDAPMGEGQPFWFGETGHCLSALSMKLMELLEGTVEGCVWGCVWV